MQKLLEVWSMEAKRELLTVRAAAAELGLSVACIRSWISARRITFVRLGRAIRIPRSVVVQLIEQNTVPARRNQ